MAALFKRRRFGSGFAVGARRSGAKIERTPFPWPLFSEKSHDIQAAAGLRQVSRGANVKLATRAGNAGGIAE
ncbi:hypothetical protein IHE49_11690 [Rhodanobacter sp. 7MK24]|uniref:hypothetical protein n=1 Tax=Rhodanobacter sp. 7MK24 TaxID=2775922 RepID=UPI00177EAED4|nr:hypothetical protein [Rhodanobacter sp. 7MK24]MBD8881141.1 hypothetical protein [Rhodanobacter sp. 7MK24]